MADWLIQAATLWLPNESTNALDIVVDYLPPPPSGETSRKRQSRGQLVGEPASQPAARSHARYAQLKQPSLAA